MSFLHFPVLIFISVSGNSNNQNIKLENTNKVMISVNTKYYLPVTKAVMLYTYKKLSEKVIKTIIIIKVKIPCAGADQKKQNCVLIRLAKQMASLTFEFIVGFPTIVLRFHCHCKNNYYSIFT